MESTAADAALADTALDAVVAAIRSVTEEDSAGPIAITAASRLERDLQLESIDLLSVNELLRQRYGPEVDLVAFVSDLDIDQIIALTVGDLVSYLVATVGGAS